MNMKSSRIIAITLAAIMLVTTFAVTTVGILKKDAKAEPDFSGGDTKRIVDEISNMTGAQKDDILKLKNEGKSWNQIMDLLADKSKASDGTKEGERSDALAVSGLGPDYLKKLQAEGYKNDDINEARMLSERIAFQLQEITADREAVIPQVKPEVGGEKDDEDELSAYTRLAGQFDLKTAVYVALKLSSEMGSMENAVDEYLYSLQAGMDIMDYFKDKKKYRKEKEEKNLALVSQKIITIAKIEERMLKQIQDNNGNNRSDIDPVGKPGSTKESDNGSNPQAPVPEVNVPKPPNPLDDVMKDINDIKNSSLNMEGR